jgi:TusA-related sulfurtransferase
MGSEYVLDVRGKMCPIPVMEVSKVARQLGSGQVIRVLATDPAARPDLEAWARRTGNEVIEAREESGYLVIRIRLR